jgi:hypothetical protein
MSRPYFIGFSAHRQSGDRFRHRLPKPPLLETPWQRVLQRSHSRHRAKRPFHLNMLALAVRCAPRAAPMRAECAITTLKPRIFCPTSARLPAVPISPFLLGIRPLPRSEGVSAAVQKLFPPYIRFRDSTVMGPRIECITMHNLIRRPKRINDTLESSPISGI